MPVYDDVTAAWDAARPILADAFHPDAYAVMRKTRTPDGYGGYTDVESQVESGRCALNVSGRSGDEGAHGPLTLSKSIYEVEMPITSGVKPSDVLMIHGRTFDVIAVTRGGDHEIFTVATAEERQ